VSPLEAAVPRHIDSSHSKNKSFLTSYVEIIWLVTTFFRNVIKLRETVKLVIKVQKCDIKNMTLRQEG